MRMKEDRMKNGQIKPGHNLQFTTSDQYAIHYSLHQNPNDSRTLVPRLEGFEKGVEAYVKYNTFYISKKQKKWADKYPFQANSLHYTPEKDFWVCPMGQRMHFIGIRESKAPSGFVKRGRRYRAQRCEGCPVSGRCHQGKNNQII